MNKNIAIFTGGSSTTVRQENDFYPTPSATTQALLDTGVLDECKTFRDPCAGLGHITDVIAENLIACYTDETLFAEDLYSYGGKDAIKVGIDFLKGVPYMVDAIVTNPPYNRKVLMPFVEKCLQESNKITAMFLKITFLESLSRKEFFANNKTLRYIMPFSNRQPVYKNGVVVRGTSNAIMYAWFVWDKCYVGNPEVVLLDNSELVAHNKRNKIY